MNKCKQTVTVVLLGVGLTLGNTAQAGFLYNLMDLGTLLASSSSVGAGINASGQVAGYSYAPYNKAHAFVTNNGVMSDLGTLDGNWSEGLGINDSGQVTGYASAGINGLAHAFVTNNGIMSDLGTLDSNYKSSYSYGTGINASGQVTGYANVNSDIHAFVTNNGVMSDLGTLGGSNSFGLGVNASGQVTGVAMTSDGDFLYSQLYPSCICHYEWCYE
jgi:probable HAF family extracellular repeat protein